MGYVTSDWELETEQTMQTATLSEDIKFVQFAVWTLHQLWWFGL